MSLMNLLCRGRLPLTTLRSTSDIGLLSHSLPKPSPFHRSLLHLTKSSPLLLLRRPASTTTSSSQARSQPRQQPSQPPPPAAPRKAFPERLLIYHAGTGKTTFLACLKLTTLFLFAFFTFVITPAYLSSPDEPLRRAAGVLACGVVPLVFVAYSTTPFVAFVHVRVPPFAQQSRDLLRRWAAAVPADARLEVTTMSWIGKPRVSGMRVGDLRPARERFGMVNFKRDVPVDGGGGAGGRGGRWWRALAQPPCTRFNVQEQSAKVEVKEGWVWREIAAGIARREGS